MLCKYVFPSHRLSLNCWFVFSCGSLSIFRTIILNWGTGSFLCSFCGVIFPWFIMISVALCRYLHIWKSSHLVWTVWIVVKKNQAAVWALAVSVYCSCSILPPEHTQQRPVTGVRSEACKSQVEGLARRRAHTEEGISWGESWLAS